MLIMVKVIYNISDLRSCDRIWQDSKNKIEVFRTNYGLLMVKDNECYIITKDELDNMSLNPNKHSNLREPKQLGFDSILKE